MKKEKIKYICVNSLVIALRKMIDFDGINKEYRRIYRLMDYHARLDCKGRFNDGITDSEREEAFKIIMAFGEKTGWLRKDKKLHALTIASFLLDIIDDDNFHPGVMKSLNRLVMKFEDDGEFKPLCLNAGKVAAEKWRKLIDEYKI